MALSREPALRQHGVNIEELSARQDSAPFDGSPLFMTEMRLTVPVAGGPAFLIGQNFSAVMSYNPAFSYALAVVHLADRIAGAGPFAQLLADLR